jgi:hypothetical protein
VSSRGGAVLPLLAALVSGCCHDVGRWGDFSVLGTNRGFPNVDAVVVPFERDGALGVRAVLSYHDDDDVCLAGDDGWRVTVDGQPLVLEHRGGAAGPLKISGVEIRISNCHAAQFMSAAGAGFTDRPVDEIVIERGDRRGEIAVRQLFTRRWLTVHPGSRLRAGDHVTLAWHPATDVWRGSGLSDSVAIFAPEGKVIRVERPNLSSRPPLFHFVVPPVPPGRARVSVSPLDSHPHAPVIACRWLRRCVARVGVGAPAPGVELVE